MRKPRVLIMISSATRDALSQLLVACYLRRRGIEVLLCNQVTFISMYERYRPEVFFSSWLNSEPMVAYLQSIQHQTRILLVDQEGGRMGEAAFKRSLRAERAVKIRAASAATRVIAWGRFQAQWLKDLGCLPEECIVVTGCPRFDPYLLRSAAPAQHTRFLGVTLRTDRLTSQPSRLMETIYESLFVDPADGLTPGLPLHAQYEDWIWQAAAVVRHMMKIVVEITRRTDAPVVLRPGPWEQASAYEFLRRRLPQVSVEPMMLQHEYVRNAFVTLDASSALGLESILAGTPVISVNALVPRLEEHVGGPGGTRLNAPYRPFYWHPSSIEEAVDQILQARQGTLPLMPDPTTVDAYFRDYVDWPAPRPASFRIGDLILEMLEMPPRERCADAPAQIDSQVRWRRSVHRVPGWTQWHHLRAFWAYTVHSPDRQLYRRYHYFPWTYPHHEAIRQLFEALWQREADGGTAPSPAPAGSEEPATLAGASR